MLYAWKSGENIEICLTSTISFYDWHIKVVFYNGKSITNKKSLTEQEVIETILKARQICEEESKIIQKKFAPFELVR